MSNTKKFVKVFPDLQDAFQEAVEIDNRTFTITWQFLANDDLDYVQPMTRILIQDAIEQGMQSGCIAGMVIEDSFDDVYEEYPTWTEVLPIDISIEQLCKKFDKYQLDKEPELREYNHDAVCKFLNETQITDCIDSDDLTTLTFRQVKQIQTFLEDKLFKLVAKEVAKITKFKQEKEQEEKQRRGETKFRWKGNPG